MIAGKVGYAYPARSFGITLLRVVADCGILLILLPSLLNRDLATALCIALISLFFTAASVASFNRFRIARNLGQLGALIERRGAAKEFSPEDYLEPLGWHAPVPVERAGIFVRGSYRILRVPGHNGFSTIQYWPLHSFILVPFEPEEINPGRLFALLHEMGHIGPRNLKNATAHIFYNIRPEEHGTWLASVQSEYRDIKSRLARFQGAEMPATLAILSLFFPLASFAKTMLVAFADPWLRSFRQQGTRLEAEIEADHYAFTAMMVISHLSQPQSPVSRSNLRVKKLFDPAPINDKYLPDIDNTARNDARRLMAVDAGLFRLRQCDFYLWRGTLQMELVMLALRIAVSVVLGVIIGAVEVRLIPWQIGLYVALASAGLIWSFVAFTRRLKQLDRTLETCRAS